MLVLLATCIFFLVYIFIYILKPSTQTEFPKIIFQTWKSKTDIPDKFRYWCNTWKKFNPQYEYVLWDDDDNRHFVSKHFPWFLKTYDSYNMEIKRADAIRYMFLYKYGGIYVDMDFECIQPFDSLLEKHKGYDIILGSMESDWSSWHMTNNIPNAIMISKPGSTFWIRVLKRMEAKSLISGRPEEQTGPIVLKEVYGTAWGYSIKLLPSYILYPISWVTNEKERQDSLNSDVISLTQTMKTRYPDSYAVTYWTHSW
jgi:mannosyltransferase OCH1-like enzyme